MKDQLSKEVLLFITIAFTLGAALLIMVCKVILLFKPFFDKIDNVL